MAEADSYFEGHLTSVEVAIALRLTDDPSVQQVIEQHFKAAAVIVETVGRRAPLDIKNAALIRVCGFLFDNPNGSPRVIAQGILGPWIERY